MRADFQRQEMSCRDVESDIEGFCVMMKRGGRVGSEKARPNPQVMLAREFCIF